jgi:hypothetical protein
MLICLNVCRSPEYQMASAMILTQLCKRTQLNCEIAPSGWPLLSLCSSCAVAVLEPLLSTIVQNIPHDISAHDLANSLLVLVSTRLNFVDDLNFGFT